MAAMDWMACEIVEAIPGKVSGVPLLRGSRVPVEQVVASHKAGESAEEIAYNYDLNLDDVRTVLSYSGGYRPLHCL
jgi:uncharacterized protein (DUF433 family)